MVALANEPLSQSVDVDVIAWARWLARSLDILLVNIALWMLKYAVSGVFVSLGYPALHWSVGWWASNWVHTPAAVGLMIAYDVILLSSLGFTPGKWLLGLRVAASDGGRSTWAAILERSAILWVVGMGLDIAILGVIAWIFAYARLASKGVTLWDKAASLVVEKTAVAWWRWAIAISIPVGAGLFTLFAGFSALASRVTG